jgi:hypothetical protein
MNNEQRLYHHKIYQKNRLLEEFKRVCGIEKRIVSLSVLNPYNHKFNWLVVDDKRWNFTLDITQNINSCYKSCKNDWRELLKRLKGHKIEELVDSIEYFENGERKKVNFAEEERKEFHFHLLNLYQYYPHEEDAGIDGVVYRNFKNKRKRLLYTKGELLTDFKNFNIYPWINMTFVYEHDVRIRSLSSQEKQSDGKQKDIEYTEATFKSEISKIQENNKGNVANAPPKDEDINKVYFNYIAPLISGYPHPDEIKRKEGLLFDGSNKKNKKTFLLDNSAIRELVNKIKYILNFPVYDASIDKNLYGNFYGNVIIPFAFKEDRDDFLKKNQRKIEENLFLLIR